MSDLLVVFDPGSSLTKIFYAVGSSKPECLLMEPEVIQVSKESIEAYENSLVGQPNPEDCAWIAVDGKYLAVGFLARTQFLANRGLDELKYERAIYKVLAAVGAIAEREAMPSGFSLSLGLLLPWGEYQDRERFERLVAQGLANFNFRFQNFSVSLELFDCKPEGGGLFLVRRRQLGEAFNQQDTSVLVIGYRNASCLTVKRGSVIKGDTSDLGFVRLVEKVQQRTSGQKAERLAPAIYKAGAKVQPKALLDLARSSTPALRQEEVAQIAQAVKFARTDYWRALSNWLYNNVPSQLNEVIISGGTAGYLHSQLKEYFSYTAIAWIDELETKIQSAFGSSVGTASLSLRLTDAYGLFLFLSNKAVKVKANV